MSKVTAEEAIVEHEHKNVVVVGVDGSEPAKQALKWAAAQARQRKASLHLLCIFELPSYAVNAGEDAQAAPGGALLYEAAETMVKEMARSPELAGLEVTWSLLDGDPSERLIEMSKDVALVVVGGHGDSRGSIADRLLRTVSTAVPAYAYCPTVVVPHLGKDVSETNLPVRTVLVGADGSDHAKLALQRAIWEADRWNAKLTVVTAVNVDVASWMPQFSLSPDLLAGIAETIQEQVDELREGRDIEIEVLALEGNPAKLMAEYSAQVDLMVMGTRGRGGFSGLLLGSTSQTVLEYTACPTMVVPRRVRPGDDQGPVKE